MVEWARETADRRRAGHRQALGPQSNLARVHAKVQVLRLMNWKQAWAAQKATRIPPSPRRSRSSAASSTSRPIAAADGDRPARRRAEGQQSRACSRAASSRAYRNGLILTFGGGTNEVQRDIIAMAGMGMPHYKD